jgi:drug/metabolite transporter (DMT)-like permease
MKIMVGAVPPLVSSYAYATPLVAAGIGVAVLGDRPWPGMAAGGALIIAAVYQQIRATTRQPDH